MTIFIKLDRLSSVKGELYLKNFGFLYIYISSNCCCIRLLANSEVLELLEAPFQSYVGFVHAISYIDSKIRRESNKEY